MVFIFIWGIVRLMKIKEPHKGRPRPDRAAAPRKKKKKLG
jgi:hypothetical protein